MSLSTTPFADTSLSTLGIIVVGLAAVGLILALAIEARIESRRELRS